MQVRSLQCRAGAVFGRELVQQHGIVFTVRHVLRKVGNTVTTGPKYQLWSSHRLFIIGANSPPLPSGSLQVEIEPPQQDLIRRQPQELFQRLPIIQQPVQFGVMLDVNLAQETTPDDLPDQPEDQVFPSFRDVLRTDVDDGASDTLGRRDDDVVVFGDLKGVEFALRGGLVENPIVNGVGHRIVDQFTQDQTVCSSARLSAGPSTDAYRAWSDWRTSAFVEQLHGVGGDWQQVPNIGVSRQYLQTIRTVSIRQSQAYLTAVTHGIDMVRKTPPLILVDCVLRVGTFCTLHRDLSLDRLHVPTSTLLQQRVQLDPILELDLACSVDIRPLERFSGRIVRGRVGRSQVLKYRSLVKLALVINVDLANVRRTTICSEPRCV